MSDNLTFPDIEQGLTAVTQDLEEFLFDYDVLAVEAIGNRELQTELVEAQQKVDGARDALRAYLKAEVQKVDSTHAWIRSMEAMIAAGHAEAERIWDMMKARERCVDWVKRYIIDVLREAGKKSVEGNRGRLRRHGNGGKQPVDIRQPELLPAKFQRFTLTLSGEELSHIINGPDIEAQEVMTRAKPTDPDTELIREALLHGHGVPGAILLDRGEHLRVE